MAISDFDNVLVEDTFVLAWQRSANCLVFDVIVSLLPTHPNYESPKPGEWACYKKGNLRFSAVTNVNGLLSPEDTANTTDPDGSVDYGTIDLLERQRDGRFRLVGDFGDVLVDADDVSLAIV